MNSFELVQETLTHRNDPKRKSSMEFKIRWQGYNSSEDTWEPWKAVRNIPALHSYLVSVGLAKLVPWEHK